VISPVDVVTWPFRAARGAVVAFRLWRQLQADADARICLGFKRQQEILSEQLREAQARRDASEEQRVRLMLHRVQDNELAYQQSRMADLAAHIVADRAPSGVIGPDLPKLPEPDRAGLDAAAMAVRALAPAKTFDRHFRLGNAFYAAGEYLKALEEYNEALKLRPDHPDTLNNRGATLDGLKRYEEALADYNRSLDIRPDYPATLNNRGFVLTKMGKLEEALADLDRSLDIRPEHPGTISSRALALVKLGQQGQAFADFARALALKSGAPGILYNRACAFSVAGHWDEALRDLAAAIAGTPRYRTEARQDMDLEALRSHPEWGPKFWELVGKEEEPS